MKKFLTVLLALSVVFTYSFATVSTTFAATDADAFSTAVSAYKAEFSYKGGYLTGDNIAQGWEGKISQKVYEDAIDAWAESLDLNDENDYVAGGVLNTSTLWTTERMAEVVENQYAVELAKYNELVDSIDLAAYNKAGKSALEAKLDEADVSIAGITDKNITAVGTVQGLITMIKDEITAQKDNLVSESTEAIAKQVADLRDTLTLVSEDFYDVVKADYANATTDPGTVAKVASFEKDFAAVVEYFNACIDKYEKQATEGEDKFVEYASLKYLIGLYFNAATPYTNFYNAKAFLEQTDILVKSYEGKAADAKVAVNADGTKTYYNADVEKLLADTLEALEADCWAAFYHNDVKFYGKTAAEEWTKLTALANNTYDLQAYRDKAIKKFTTNIGKDLYALANWTGDRADKVEAIQKDYEEKVLLAATVEEIDALVDEAKDKIDAIMTAAEVNAVAKKVADRVEAAGYLTDCSVEPLDGEGTVTVATGDGFSAYFDVVVGKSTTYKPAIKTDALIAAAQVFVDAVLAEENDSITYKQIDAIIAANKDAAYAALTNVKTTAELKDEAAAVKALIEALPATITVADKDQVLAAQAAMDAYLENAGAAQTDVSKYATLKTALTTVINAEAREVTKLIRNIPAKVTVENADQIAAARSAYDAWDEAYGDYVGTKFTNTVAAPNETTLKNAEKALEDAKLVHVAKLIGALNSNSTIEEIEAAKAAFDAMDTKHKLALNDQLYNKLMNAVATAEAAAKEATIKAVESLKIKASSSAVKGKITVKWNVTGDVPAGTVYKVYKSTKAQSGYAYMGKTTKNYMANKKNLKKGKRYFYKVKAVLVVDGVTYTSDWSNKANRFAK